MSVAPPRQYWQVLSEHSRVPPEAHTGHLGDAHVHVLKSAVVLVVPDRPHLVIYIGNVVEVTGTPECKINACTVVYAERDETYGQLDVTKKRGVAKFADDCITVTNGGDTQIVMVKRDVP
jgi:hypothetical protein